jgi:hypothetical protein
MDLPSAHPVVRAATVQAIAKFRASLESTPKTHFDEYKFKETESLVDELNKVLAEKSGSDFFWTNMIAIASAFYLKNYQAYSEASVKLHSSREEFAQHREIFRMLDYLCGVGRHLLIV